MNVACSRSNFESRSDDWACSVDIARIVFFRCLDCFFPKTQQACHTEGRQHGVSVAYVFVPRHLRHCKHEGVLFSSEEVPCVQLLHPYSMMFRP